MKSSKEKTSESKRVLTDEERSVIIQNDPLFRRMHKQAEERLRKSPPPEWMLR